MRKRGATGRIACWGLSEEFLFVLIPAMRLHRLGLLPLLFSAIVACGDDDDDDIPLIPPDSGTVDGRDMGAGDTGDGDDQERDGGDGVRDGGRDDGAVGRDGGREDGGDRRDGGRGDGGDDGRADGGRGDGGDAMGGDAGPRDGSTGDASSARDGGASDAGGDAGPGDAAGMDGGTTDGGATVLCDAAFGATPPTCGGDPSGMWRFSNACGASVLEQQLRAQCATVSTSVQSRSASGTLSLMGSRYDLLLVDDITATATVPPVCATAVGGCAAIPPLLGSVGASGVCTSLPNGSCSCQVSHTLRISESGTYSLSGATIVAGSRTYDHCVLGSSLKLRERSTGAVYILER